MESNFSSATKLHSKGVWCSLGWHTHNVQIQLQLMHFMRLMRLSVVPPCSLQNISLHHQLATFPQTCLRVKFKLFGRVGGVKGLLRPKTPKDVCVASQGAESGNQTRGEDCSLLSPQMSVLVLVWALLRPISRKGTLRHTKYNKLVLQCEY